jgi:hypothetical protein
VHSRSGGSRGLLGRCCRDELRPRSVVSAFCYDWQRKWRLG